jgi:hypothetical protein
MVSRVKKPAYALNNKALALTTQPFSIRNQILALFQQVWYLPFIWSLTYYLYWAYRDAFVFHKSLFQANPLNNLGICVSLAVLLAKLLIGPKVDKIFSALEKTDPDFKTILPPQTPNSVTEIKNSTPRKEAKNRNNKRPVHLASTQTSEANQVPEFDERFENSVQTLLTLGNSKLKPTNPTNEPPVLQKVQLNQNGNLNQEIHNCPKSKNNFDDCLLCTELITCQHRKHAETKTPKPDKLLVS